MDFSEIELVRDKFKKLFDHIRVLKGENLELKKRISLMEENLHQVKASSTTEIDENKRNFSELIEERNRLVEDRELLRKEVHAVLEKIDFHQSEES
ncbi:MAG TPA: hypothetical protein QF720_06350 [Nitrospinota bacterium]|jgi:uncharacterized protein YicC (UPF0701 family)|nr:hypothetical protein [Nitrospinota bacterium]|tara:strand:- start:253532 stop:253819 length:288 start_codon:yes stop_codon:yes gene_type:complete